MGAVRQDPTRFRCGDPRTPENTTTKGECRRCKNARQVAFYQASSVTLRQPKGAVKRTPKAIRWTVAPDFPAVLAECRPRFEAAMAPPKPTGRPRKAQVNIPTSEAA